MIDIQKPAGNKLFGQNHLLVSFLRIIFSGLWRDDNENHGISSDCCAFVFGLLYAGVHRPPHVRDHRRSVATASPTPSSAASSTATRTGACPLLPSDSDI